MQCLINSRIFSSMRLKLDNIGNHGNRNSRKYPKKGLPRIYISLSINVAFLFMLTFITITNEISHALLEILVVFQNNEGVCRNHMLSSE